MIPDEIASVNDLCNGRVVRWDLNSVISMHVNFEILFSPWAPSHR